jgi:thiamine pyrophosphokinase
MKTLIITGGSININFAKEYLKKYSFNLVIVADKGLEAAYKMDILPNYIIGDFDSVNKNILNKYNNTKVKIIKLNPEKDYTDTHMALKLAIEEKSTDITIIRSYRR